ncbi:hypothetical protein A1O1_05651 [Capronia coronata CBS 617.96]|uniref:TAFII55 protein conserved region domain-containing protein n=1 Tax=Capronia coronata CBS 617.96 TaxID=1182541 RepID=W9Z2H9_9EURO|nr:uncharacterized protein A1O1_05651 [Capronia coronata CBS 617.96]EXJ88719.1 hypothetical protein A1O1_05651 [Capronia coronata CBS 617.96]
MAGGQKTQRSAPQTPTLEVTGLPPFVTLRISPQRLRASNLPETPARWMWPTNRGIELIEGDSSVMNAQDAWNENLAMNPAMEVDGTAAANHPPANGSLQPPDAETSTNQNKKSQTKGRNKAKGSPMLHPPAHHRQRRGKSSKSSKSSIKHEESFSTLSRRRTKGTAATAARTSSRRVTLTAEHEVLHIDSSPHQRLDEDDRTLSDADDVNSFQFASEDDTMSDASEQHALPPPQRPSLKLKLSKPVIPQVEGNQGAQTPAATSATRTPSIKLKFGATPTLGSAKAANKEEDTITVTPVSSTKKRKRPYNANESEDEIARPAPKPPVFRKLTLKTDPSPRNPPPVPKPAPSKVIKIKAKGKPPKRPLGVGYDSELEEREADPVIHEGFILRMQPGPDCDYLRKAIADGTVGLPRAQGGADVRMRMLDTSGRRGIMIIRGNQYATTLVDLPCIIEGMKSWDKKGWIKSVDISQMLLVLGRCNTDEEARNYPLPEDVDPNNYQYAHGITAPMKWVRKRRFARTKRARVDDIEAIERRVNALLEADKAALSTKYQLLDHDPRLDEERYSSGLEGEDDDAEAEYDDDPEGYFDPRNEQNGGDLETPMFTETPVEDIGQDEVDEFERMFAGDDDLPAADPAPQTRDTLHVPEVGDSSFGVTSTSASPSVTVAHTPASAAEASSDEDEEDDGGDDDEDLDDAEKEGDENLQQIKDRIQDMQQKITEQTEVLKQTQNAILKKKLARKIQDLKDDVAMMKKNAGLGGDEDED